MQTRPSNDNQQQKAAPCPNQEAAGSDVGLSNRAACPCMCPALPAIPCPGREAGGSMQSPGCTPGGTEILVKLYFCHLLQPL